MFLQIMHLLLRIARGIDAFSEWTGRLVYWLTLLMVLLGAYNAIVRYFIDPYFPVQLSSNTWIELQWYLFSLIFLLGAAYGLKHDEHVRVDIFYGKLSPKGQAWINLLGTVLFLIPFCILVLYFSWPIVMSSWERLEQSDNPGGLPRYPIKTVPLIAFVFLLAQGLSMLIKQVAILTDTLPPEAQDEQDPGNEAVKGEGV